ncbi:MAG: hypothetical protein JXR83_00200 [Deltaproteobacteria bacterium]|nr:hypothetical protein [Deltaproteobacteria bacterium]
MTGTESATAALAAPELRQRLLALAPGRRVDFLIGLSNCRQVLRNLHPQDLLIAIHAAGVSDSLELIELLPAAQVQCFIDLEAWRRDRIDPHRLVSWLSVLYAASRERALAQVMGLDAELVTLLLKLYTRVYDLAQEAAPEPLPEGSLRTPDHRFLVTFVTPLPPADRDQTDPLDEIGATVARQIVAGLIAREPLTAARYLEATRWELPSELEEASLRWRQGRLNDLGYFDLYEALAIYAPIDLGRPPRSRRVDVGADAESADAALALFVDEHGRAPLLRRALDELAAAASDQVRRQLVTLANRVAAARAATPDDLPALASAVVEALATVNLGLEYLSRGAAPAAVDLLGRVSLIELFRYGHTLAWQLGQQARKLRHRLRLDAGHTLLPAAAAGLFEALCRKVPRLHTGLLDPQRDEPGESLTRDDEIPFETLSQLARAAEAVAETAFLAALLLDVLGFDPRRTPALVEQAVNVGDTAAVDLELILATALCRAALGGELEPQPFDRAELSELRRLVARGVEQVRGPLVELLAARARPRLPLPGAVDEDAARRRATAFAERLARRLAEDLGAVSGDVDPRFVAALLCRLR